MTFFFFSFFFASAGSQRFYIDIIINGNAARLWNWSVRCYEWGDEPRSILLFACLKLSGNFNSLRFYLLFWYSMIIAYWLHNVAFPQTALGVQLVFTTYDCWTISIWAWWRASLYLTSVRLVVVGLEVVLTMMIAFLRSLSPALQRPYWEVMLRQARQIDRPIDAHTAGQEQSSKLKVMLVIP